MYAILVYDISGENNGQRVLNKTFKICKRYLAHIQNSVFEGEISESQMTKLEYELNKIIRKDLDSVIIFVGRSQKWLNKKFLGKKDDLTSNFF